MIFQLSEEQQLKLNQWVRLKNTELAEKQRKDPNFTGFVTTDEEGNLYPDLGAIGGGISIMFTPTGIGDFVKAYWCHGSKIEDSLDLSEYDLF